MFKEVAEIPVRGKRGEGTLSSRVLKDITDFIESDMERAELYGSDYEKKSGAATAHHLISRFNLPVKIAQRRGKTYIQKVG